MKRIALLIVLFALSSSGQPRQTEPAGATIEVEAHGVRIKVTPGGEVESTALARSMPPPPPELVVSGELRRAAIDALLRLEDGQDLDRDQMRLLLRFLIRRQVHVP
jgi:hypothetical protein